jgi:amino acid efflux transporter
MEPDTLMRATADLFIAVYITATAAGSRLLTGRARSAARVSLAVVVAVFAFSGAYVIVPLAVAGLATLAPTGRPVAA